MLAAPADRRLHQAPRQMVDRQQETAQEVYFL